MQPNFRCPKTGKTFKVHRYSMKQKDDGVDYIDPKTGGHIINPENKEPLEYIGGHKGYPAVGRFGSMSREEKIKSLKKRSDAHNDSQKKKTGKIFATGK